MLFKHLGKATIQFDLLLALLFLNCSDLVINSFFSLRGSFYIYML